MDAKIGFTNNIILAKIIITQIENGEIVNYDGIIIKGNLDLDGIKLPRDENDRYIIKKAIKITNSNINQPMKICNVNFLDRVDFSGTTFVNSDLMRSRFSKFANFEDAIFTGYASFSNVEFLDDVSFTNSQFAEGTLVRFDEAKFQKDVFFWGRRNKNTLFGGESYFRHAVFYGIAEFSKAVFSGKADFSFCRFSGEGIRLINTQFNDEVSFVGSKVKGTADFIYQ
jgi:uncharacterized protein YjbI with pentapeptide repeats